MKKQNSKIDLHRIFWKNYNKYLRIPIINGWFNRHIRFASFVNYFLKFISNNSLDARFEGGCKENDWKDFRTMKWKYKVTPADFGLIRISKHDFLRNFLMQYVPRFLRKKLRIGWGYIDKDFMIELYVPFYDWYAYIQYAKEEASREVHEHCVLSDPMNGCPGDFAEDFNRRQHYRWVKSERLRCPEWFKQKVFRYYHKKVWDKYYQNPAPWDYEEEFSMGK